MVRSCGKSVDAQFCMLHSETDTQAEGMFRCESCQKILPVGAVKDGGAPSCVPLKLCIWCGAHKSCSMLIRRRNVVSIEAGGVAKSFRA